MASRNRVKSYSENTYYHVYNRGINKRRIFIDEQDYSVFLNLLKRHLASQPQNDKKGRPYIWLYDQIELIAFCLMPNHFHLYVYQINDVTAMQTLLKLVSGSYTSFFNKKYGRVGPLFQDTYKATYIANDAYAQHITRYIHLNPKDYIDYPYSSLNYYLGNKHADWIHPERVLEMFRSTEEYMTFVDDYVDYKKMLDELKHDLADN